MDVLWFVVVMCWFGDFAGLLACRVVLVVTILVVIDAARLLCLVFD